MIQAILFFPDIFFGTQTSKQLCIRDRHLCVPGRLHPQGRLYFNQRTERTEKTAQPMYPYQRTGHEEKAVSYTHLDVYKRQTYNMLNVDAVTTQVKDVTLFILDQEGNYIVREEVDSLTFQDVYKRQL